jgi:hypothetical protein
MLKLVRRSFILLLFLLSLVSFYFIPSTSAQVRDPVHVLTLRRTTGTGMAYHRAAFPGTPGNSSRQLPGDVEQRAGLP